jgi:signal transduction histidine kinase
LGRDGLIGILDVQDDRPFRFTASELDTFSTLAGQIAVAIENARIFDELKAANLRLREVDRLKSEFLANMSHELRTPLNSIIGYGELLLLGVNGELDAETRGDIQAIFDNGQLLLALINDLLDLAKIEAGKMRLELEAVDVKTLLEDVRVSNAGLILRKPLSLEVEVEEGLPLVQVDPVRIRQILGNLLSNAVKFTSEGRIRLRAYRQGDALFLAVQDSGIGIAAEAQEGIFDKFRQVDGSFTRRSDGTGLGLAITRHLVDLHGGQISVESSPGRGSVFTVRLPLGASRQNGLPPRARG